MTVQRMIEDETAGDVTDKLNKALSCGAKVVPGTQNTDHDFDGSTFGSFSIVIEWPEGQELVPCSFCNGRGCGWCDSIGWMTREDEARNYEAKVDAYSEEKSQYWKKQSALSKQDREKREADEARRRESRISYRIMRTIRYLFVREKR